MNQLDNHLNCVLATYLLWKQKAGDPENNKCAIDAFWFARTLAAKELCVQLKESKDLTHLIDLKITHKKENDSTVKIQDDKHVLTVQIFCDNDGPLLMISANSFILARTFKQLVRLHLRYISLMHN